MSQPLSLNNIDIILHINNKYKPLNKIKGKDFYWTIIDSKDYIPNKMAHDLYIYIPEYPDEVWQKIFSSPFNSCREAHV